MAHKISQVYTDWLPLSTKGPKVGGKVSDKRCGG